MKFKLLLVLIFICCGSLHAQAYGAKELLFSPSSKSNGIGECGVSRAYDKSMYSNPAALGIYAKENRQSVSIFPIKSNIIADVNFSSRFVVIPFQKYTPESKYLFTLGAYSSSTKLGIYEETTVEFPDGTGNYYQPHLQNHNLVFSVAYISDMHISIGGTFKAFKENIFEVETKGTAFDLGILFQYPIIQESREVSTYFHPAFGASIRNLGSDVDLGVGMYRTSQSTSSKFKLPKVTSFGLTLELGVIDTTKPAKQIYAFYPTFELVKQLDYDYYNRLGFEAQIFKAISLRVGYINERYGENITTKGFSFELQHFLWMLNPSLSEATSDIGSLFGKYLSVEYSYAKNSDDVTYQELTVHTVVFY